MRSSPTLRAALTATVFLTGLASVGRAQHGLLQQMVGTWDVAPRMWTGPGTEPIVLPPAVAHRRLVGNTFVEEVMEGAPGSNQEPFTRIATFNYNPVTQQFEAISIDTRGPQVMYYKSHDDHTPFAGTRPTLRLDLDDVFVLPQWGNTPNVAYKGRKEVALDLDRQIVRLYWTPLTGTHRAEFLAVEYVYDRRRR